jgi:hypothetical protein
MATPSVAPSSGSPPTVSLGPPGHTPPGPVSPPRPPRFPRVLAVGAVVVVAVVVVIAALFVGGVFHSNSSGNGAAGSGVLSSYSAAEGPAQTLAAATSGGPWTLDSVVGLDLTTTYLPTSSDGCVLSGGAGYVPISGYTGNYSTGRLSSWGFIFVNPGSTTELGVDVTGGRATDVGTATVSAVCPVAPAPLGAIATEVLDSTQIATDAYANPLVQTYLAAHASSNVSVGLLDEGSPDGTVWGLSYSTCNPANLSVPAGGTRVDELFNATTGTKIGSASFPSGTACKLSTPTDKPIGDSFTAGTPTLSSCGADSTYTGRGCVTGDYVFTLAIDASSVTFGSVEFQVKTPSGTIVTTDGANGFSVLNASGAVEAQSGASPTLSMTTPFGTYGSGLTNTSGLPAGDRIEIDMGTENPVGLGELFIVLGTGVYSGVTSPVALSPPGPSPIGSAIALGNPVRLLCTVGDTYALNGCAAGDYAYMLTIEVSTVTFGSVELDVRNATNGNLTASGANGFSVLGVSGAVVAQSGPSSTLAMTATFDYPGLLANNSTALTNLFAITIDLGTSDPAGQGYSVVVLGIGMYSGSSSPLALP